MPRRHLHSYFDCVYIIKILPTGHFYIGASSNYENRKKTHYEAVRDLIKIRQGKTADQFKFFRETTVMYKSAMHYDLAEILKPLVDVQPSLLMRSIKKMMIIDIIHMCECTEDVKNKEGIELVKYKGDPLCLNRVFKSAFTDKKIPHRVK